MESDPNPFPQLDLLPGFGVVRKIGRLGSSVVGFLNIDDITDMEGRGAAQTLDSELYDHGSDTQLTIFD